MADIMLVNNELFPRHEPASAPMIFEGGIKIYDNRRPHQPAPDRALQIAGLAPFSDSDGAYAYISSEENGFCRRHRRDPRPLADPTRPRADRALVDAGAMGPKAARPRPGRAAAIAAIIRCAAATGSITS